MLSSPCSPVAPSIMAAPSMSRARPGSSRCDFVGLEPSPSPAPPDSRRPSQAVNSQLQALHDEWNERTRRVMPEERPHLLTTSSIEPTKWLELGGSGERLAFTVVFPWMVSIVRCDAAMKLSQLKVELFDSLRKMSVVKHSMEASDYVFYGVTLAMGDFEDVFDEEQTVGALYANLTQPFPMLFLHMPDGVQHEKTLGQLIGRAIGRPLTELESKLGDEIKQYRVELYQETERAASGRGQAGFFHFAFPEEKEAVFAEEAPKELINKINSASLRYQLFFRSLEDEEAGIETNLRVVDVEFDQSLTPHSLIERALQTLSTNQGVVLESQDAADFLLQIVAQRNFLTGNSRNLIKYASVRTALEDYRIPRFVVRRKSVVLRDYTKPEPLYKPGYMRAHESRVGTDEQQAKTAESEEMNLWDIDDFFHVRPVSCTNLGNSDTGSMVYAAFAIVVGRHVLASAHSGVAPVYNPRWVEKAVDMDMYMKDLPPCAILCISLIEVRETKATRKFKERNRKNSDAALTERPSGSSDEKEKERERESGGGRRKSRAAGLDRKKEEKPSHSIDMDNLAGYERRSVGWVNVPMFDWKNELMQGAYNVGLWPGAGPGAEESNHFISIEGDVGVNEGRMGVSRLIFEPATFSSKKRVVPPSQALYDAFTDQQLKWGKLSRPTGATPKPSEEDAIRLASMLRRHQLGERMNEEEQAFAWSQRCSISRHSPNALILLVDNKETWRSREHYTDLYELLDDWPVLDIGAAFSLLDKKILDQRIRGLAVSNISQTLDDSCFALYILPLIQALKGELRASCELSRMLLKRALYDYRIGQKLFWLLRSELSNVAAGKEDAEPALRLAVLLEGYLRGNPEHLQLVVRQVDMVERLTKLSVIIKAYNEKNSATKRLRDELKEQLSYLEKIDSPLDPSSVLGELKIEQCKVLGSAKMPLRLAWRNVNPLADKFMPVYEIIFKNGDDLRQDMLVLQMLEIMDSIWKRRRLDSRLCIYPVLPMGSKIGMIGVVQECKTIFEIQSETSKISTAVSSFDTAAVNKFLKDNHTVSKEYLECVDRFLMSCVAYSVATYIMGIKDRHNDNIMMTHDGRLFHIDFGHILGHGKTKLGIQRDRTPFAITEHFLCVIDRSGDRQKPNGDQRRYDLIKFKGLCVDAYLHLWENRNLFLSLFSMMRNMALPELSTEADLDYLKNALCIEKGENRLEAEHFFGAVFEEALKSSWSTKTNWLFHTLKHL